LTAAEPTFTSEVASRYDESRGLPGPALTQLHDSIRKAAGLRAGSRLLEAGAGTGAIASSFVGRGYRYIGVDSSAAMLARFRARADSDREAALLLADLRSIPLAGEAFDAVLAIRVFGVVPSWRRFVGECLRVLRPGGVLIAGRTQRPSDSAREQLRRARNELLNAAGGEMPHLGSTDQELLQELSSQAGSLQQLPPIEWEASTTLARLIDQNLSGWRVQALTPAARASLRDRLCDLMRKRWGPMDCELREQQSLQLHCFRKD
jgi:ubiquinone/menaquinone biosynthesis C-methylase UbiE